MTDTQKASSSGSITAYACVVGAFQAQLIFGLVMRAFGVIYLIILEEFHTSATVAAWIGATHNLVAGVSCLFTSRMCQKYGCRLVAGVGVMFHCAGFLLTAFANNVYVMYASFGVITAIGTSCATTSGFLIVSISFTKNRALATSIASSGSSVSVLFMPVVVNFLYEYYGFQGCMIVLSGICLQGLVSAALYGLHKPPSSAEVEPRSESSVKLQNNTGATAKHEGVENKAFDIVETPNGKVSSDRNKAFDSREHMFDEGLYMQGIRRKSYIDMRTPRRPSRLEDLENAFDSREFMFEEEFQSPRLKKKSIGWNTKAQLKISAMYGTENSQKKQTMPKMIQIMKENPLVIGIILVNFASTFVASSMSTFMPAFGEEKGHSTTASLLLITWNGIASTIGRISLGFLLDTKRFRSKRFFIYNLCALFSAMAALLTPLRPSYWWITFTSVMCGAFIGTVFVQRTTVLVDQVGVKRMPAMFGLVQTVNSLGFTMGTGFGGVMRDSLGTYSYHYYLGGSICLVTSIVVLLCAALKYRRDAMTKQ